MCKDRSWETAVSAGERRLRLGFLRLGGGRGWRGGFEEVGGFLGEAREGVVGDLEGALGHEGVDRGGGVAVGDPDEHGAGGDGFELGGQEFGVGGGRRGGRRRWRRRSKERFVGDGGFIFFSSGLRARVMVTVLPSKVVRV